MVQLKNGVTKIKLFLKIGFSGIKQKIILVQVLKGWEIILG
jgi:hypothetical protein